MNYKEAWEDLKEKINKAEESAYNEIFTLIHNLKNSPDKINGKLEGIRLIKKYMEDYKIEE